MLMTQYSYEILADERGYPSINLTELSSGKVRTFKIGHFKYSPEYVSRLCDHMNSLTDGLCSSWFMEQKHKSKPKKTA